MALIIDIYQVGRRGDLVEYEYDCNGRKGRFVVDAGSRAVQLVKMAPGERDEQWFQPAKRRIELALRDGKLPERAVWAS